MTQAGGNSRCGELLSPFSLDLCPLINISIGGKGGQISKLTGKHLLEKA